MALPFPVLATSQIQKRKKAVLLGLFALGLFITIIQIIRIQTVQRLANYTDSAPLILWSCVENNLGIIIACIPTLAPLVKYFSERTRGGTSGGGGTKREVGSRYAMQSWRMPPKGSTVLGSRHEEEVGEFGGHVAGVVENSGDSKGSAEFILDTGIRKKVEINITRA